MAKILSVTQTEFEHLRNGKKIFCKFSCGIISTQNLFLDIYVLVTGYFDNFNIMWLTFIGSHCRITFHNIT